jgi:hypothetical protein
MILIAHRGNLNGQNTKLENSPEYILNALNKGFDCEIDIRYINKKLFLGHDTPDYEIDIKFLLENSKKLWIHCKNFDAIHYLLDYKDLNIFWHQEDEYTLTSKGQIMTYPGKKINNKSIIVMPEWNNKKISKKAYGVCSDYINIIKKSIKDK